MHNGRATAAKLEKVAKAAKGKASPLIRCLITTNARGVWTLPSTRMRSLVCSKQTGGTPSATFRQRLTTRPSSNAASRRSGAICPQLPSWKQISTTEPTLPNWSTARSVIRNPRLFTSRGVWYGMLAIREHEVRHGSNQPQAHIRRHEQWHASRPNLQSSFGCSFRQQEAVPVGAVEERARPLQALPSGALYFSELQVCARFAHWFAMRECQDLDRHPAKDCPNA